MTGAGTRCIEGRRLSADPFAMPASGALNVPSYASRALLGLARSRPKYADLPRAGETAGRGAEARAGRAGEAARGTDGRAGRAGVCARGAEACAGRAGEAARGAEACAGR